MNRDLLLTSLLLACVAGCGDIPIATMPEMQTDDSWLNDSRGGYNWDAAGGIFSVDAPSRWTYFGEVDRTLVAENLKRPEYTPPAHPLVPDEVPEGFDSFEYVRLREKTPEMVSPLASIPVAGEVRHFQMTSTGEHLLVVDAEVAVWDISEKPKRRKARLPAIDFEAIYLANDGKTLSIVTSQEALLIDSLTGKVLNRWRPVASEIILSDFARQNGYLLVGQRDRRVVLLDEKLRELKFVIPTDKEVSTFNLGEIQALATNETGSLCAISFGNSSFQFTFTDDGAWTGQLFGNGTLQSTEVGAGVQASAFWKQGVLIDDRTISEPNVGSNDYEFIMHCENVDLSIAHLTDQFQWACMLNRVYLNGDWQYAVQDSGMHYWGSSAPISLGPERPVGLSGDLAHEFLAIVYPSRIDLIQRRRWSNTTLKCHHDNLMSGLKGDDPMQIIRTYEELGKTKGLLPVGLTGEELLAYSSNLIGHWIYESKYRSGAVPEDAQEWLEEGSRLALATQCSAEMYRRLYWYVDEYSASGYEQIANQLNRESPESLLAILSEATLLAHDVIANQERMSQLAKRATELYPNNVLIHVLLNRGDAVKGMQLSAVNAYLAELVKCYPEAQRDRIYAEFALQICAPLNTDFATSEGSLNVNRLSAGFQQIASERTLELDNLTKILNFAFESNDEALAKCIGEHQLAHHPLLPVYGFDPQIYEIAIEHYRSLGRRDGE